MCASINTLTASHQSSFEREGKIGKKEGEMGGGMGTDGSFFYADARECCVKSGLKGLMEQKKNLYVAF